MILNWMIGGNSNVLAEGIICFFIFYFIINTCSHEGGEGGWCK